MRPKVRTPRLTWTLKTSLQGQPLQSHLLRFDMTGPSWRPPQSHLLRRYDWRPLYKDNPLITVGSAFPRRRPRSAGRLITPRKELSAELRDTARPRARKSILTCNSSPEQWIKNNPVGMRQVFLNISLRGTVWSKTGLQIVGQTSIQAMIVP